jgi:hypothetical protein
LDPVGETKGTGAKEAAVDEAYQEIYDDIYTQRVRGFPAAFSPPPIGPQTVADSIEAADESLLSEGRHLRSDAKAFLAVNFQDLIVVPVMARGAASISEIRDDVGHDIKLLTTRAEPSERTALVAGISAHGIIDALARSWSDLRIGRYRLWEQE